MSKFAFVGGTAARTKIDWPVELEAAVCRLAASGVSARDAFIQAVAEYNSANGTSIVLPPSYGKHAASLLWSLRKRVTARCEKGDAETLAAFEGLVTPTEQ